MLFNTNLDNIIFTKEQLIRCDELIILSGYVGPNPIHRLQELRVNSTVIYGMYGAEGIQQSLHDALIKENSLSSKVNILYSTIPVHSKCYIWKNKGEIVSALIGSANFSVNGLTTPYKEILADATSDTFSPLEDYLKLVLNKSIVCEDATAKKNKKKEKLVQIKEQIYDKDICSMPLYITDKFGNKTVPESSGINWGLAKLNGSHVNINDAYIAIGVDLVEHYPELFPQKSEAPSSDIGKKGHRHNDNIEILWDDGTSMLGLLEGNRIDKSSGQNILYPKQISSFPKKSILGKYLRNRMKIPEGKYISYEDLEKYGRTTVDVSLQGEGVYYFDFSVSK